MRLRAAVLAGVLGLGAAVAVSVPVARDRGVPVTDRCAGYAAPAQPAPGLLPQSGVRGSLGADEAVVTAVLRTGWAALGPEDGPGTPLDPGTARVRLVERTPDGIVGVVGANGSGTEARYGRDAVVAGPDPAHLRGLAAPQAYEGTAGLADPGVVPATRCTPARRLTPGTTPAVA